MISGIWLRGGRAFYFYGNDITESKNEWDGNIVGRMRITHAQACLFDTFGVYICIYMPFSIIFDSNILPMEFILINLDKNPLSILVTDICKDYHFSLFSCFKPYYLPRITISDIPCLCLRIEDPQ